MWLQETSISERRTLLAGYLGFGVDGFDFMIYTFIIPTLLSVWALTKAEAGYIATASLLTSAIGGWAAGILADRYGRVRILQVTVLWFALFTFASGFAQDFKQLLATRALQGFGFGGEWSVGSVLVAESIDARHRGKASGLVQSSWAVGWAAAALAFWLVNTLVPAAVAWRILFWLGILPALLILYVRRYVPESPVFVGAGHSSAVRRSSWAAIFAPPLLRTTVLASFLCSGMLAAYYAVTTWLPTYLKTERSLSSPGTSGYLLVLIAGSWVGYLTSAWLTDRLGRRRCFIVFAVCATILVVGYIHLPITDSQMLLLGFPLGFFLSGIFSGMGAFLAELYPNAVRGSGQGFCYNVGRAVGGLSPAVIGAWSSKGSLANLIAGAAVLGYGVVILTALALPETRGRLLSPG